MTSLPVIEGIRFLSIYAYCIFRQSQIEPRQNNFTFKSY